MKTHSFSFAAFFLLITAAGHLCAAQDSTDLLRKVQGQTILSPEVPKAELTFAKEFHYVGGQRVNLYNMADAEQHLFVKAKGGTIDAFYWVQFEHRLPADKHTYNYKGRTTEIGGLNFIYDVKSWSEYASDMLEDPESDGAAISRLAEKEHLAFPKRAARVRMFHLPTPDRRTELMIIYGEALPENSSTPVKKDGVDLDSEAPPAAKAILDDAKQGMIIHAQ